MSLHCYAQGQHSWNAVDGLGFRVRVEGIGFRGLGI